MEALQLRQLEIRPGEVIQGFHAPGFVELVRVPTELEYSYVLVKKVSEQYNLARGGVSVYRVDITDWVNLTRLPDERSERGSHGVAVFSFEAAGKNYLLRYDPGSAETFAALTIEPR
jgi:hypothetical protein